MTRILKASSLILLVAGIVGSLWFLYFDLLGGRGALLCANPKDVMCSGQYVYGFPNEVWSGLAIVLGAGGLIACRALESPQRLADVR